MIRDEAVTALLAELVRIPSPYFEEEAVMGFTRDWLTARGVPAVLHRYREDRICRYDGTNVIASLEGGEPGPTVILNGHLDTVRLCGGWTRDPYGAGIEGSRLYGLGACDMKSGCAALMSALVSFVGGRPRFRGRILLSLVSCEEGPFGLGTDSLILDGFLDGSADVAVVAEPSSAFLHGPFPSLCLGARGGWNYRVRVKGRSAHGSEPEKGCNAVVEAAKILLELERTPLPRRGKLGAGSLCCVDFRGGGQALCVPDEAEFSVFRHTLEGEDRESLMEEARGAVARADIRGTAEVRFRDAPHPACDGFPAYVLEEDHPMVEALQGAFRRVLGRGASCGYFPSVGDFCYFGGRLKVPTLVTGPAGGNYHGADEWVDLESVSGTARVLEEFLEGLLA